MRVASVRLTTASVISTSPSGTTIRARTSLRHIGADSHGNPLAGAVGVQALAQLLAGLEERDVFVLDIDRVPRARIASLPGRAMLHREGAKSAQLHPIAARKRVGDLIEHDIDDALDIAMEEMRIGGGDFLNQFRFDHRTFHLARAGHVSSPANSMQGAKPR